MLDRRKLLGWAAWTAMAGMLGCGSIGPAAAKAAGRTDRFAPAPGAMRYSRRLVRDLAGGFSITVERDFAVRFVAAADAGFSVTGAQIGVEVAVPRGLEKLGELERQRVEDGLFPLRLDSHGRIAGGPAALPPADALDAAVAEVWRLLQGARLTASERSEAEVFVEAIHRSAAALSSRLPADLFAPAEALQVERRTIDLPGMSSGTIEVVFTAAADPRTGVMQSARREIVTEIAGDSRRTREDWTLAPL